MDLFDTWGHFLVSTASAIIGATIIIIPGVKQMPQQPETTDFTTIQLTQNFALEGNYQYLGQYLQYEILIPKKGGQISGEVKGVCKGTVSGNYQPGHTPQVEGNVVGNCKITFITQDASAKFSGRIDQGEKKVYLDWIGDGFIAGRRGSVTLDLLSE